MKDNNNNSKQVLLSVLGVAILVVAVVGVSFAAFSYQGIGKVENKITTGTITMNYKEPINGINLTEALPMSDSDGMALTGDNKTFDFTVTASVTGDATINYAIVAVPDEGNSGTAAVTDDTVKVYLTDQEDTATGNTTDPKILSSLASSDTASSAGVPGSLGGYVLKTGTYSGTSNSDSYRLRMWIDAAATAPSTSETYTLRVNVYGQANAQ